MMWYTMSLKEHEPCLRSNVGLPSGHDKDSLSLSVISPALAKQCGFFERACETVVREP